MRFLKSALLGLASAALAFAPVAVNARELIYYFTLGEWVCDIRDCTGTAALASNPFAPGRWADQPDNTWIAPVRLINGQYPGPAIVAFEGEVINVKFINQAEGPTSLHWHGMHQRGTDFMDGVTYITQCPIEAYGGSFDYTFYADPAGSHWYHSHASIEAIEGVAGPLLVRRVVEPLNAAHAIGKGGSGVDNPENPMAPAYSERVLAVTQLWQSTRMMHLLHEGQSVYLLNGKFQDGSAKFPWQQISVISGQCYRFRLMFLDAADNNGAFMTYEIDNHKMTVIETDGIPTDPMDAKGVKMIFAQRTDVVVCPKAGKANYYIKMTPTLPDNFSGRLNPPFKAVLSVDGATLADAFAPVDTTETGPLPIFFEHLATTSYATLANLHFPPHFFFSVGYEGTTTLPQATHSVALTVAARMRVVDGPQFAGMIGADVFMSNDSPFKFPSSPLTHSPKCAHPNTHSTFLPYDAVVDVIFNNPFEIPHPMHLHGGSFWLLGSSYSVNEANNNEDTPNLAKCPPNEIIFGELSLAFAHWACAYNPTRLAARLNTVNPNVRDTVTVPPHGWTVIRWRTNNPGYWFFHCHTESHMSSGMLHVFNVAPELREPTPHDAPQCGPCRTDKSWETTLGNSEPASLTAHGKTVFGENSFGSPGFAPPASATTNVFCSKPNDDETRSRVNVNFGSMFDGFGK